MVEIKLAAKETLYLTFGGSNGFDAHSYTITDDELARLNKYAELCKELEQIQNPVYVIDGAFTRKLQKLMDGIPPWGSVTAEERQTWRPIETAPKDGTSLLLYHYRNGEFVGKWSTSIERWCIAGSDGFGEPSFWMPLPEPPK